MLFPRCLYHCFALLPRCLLVGINTAILSPSGGSSGIGFALPSNVVAMVAKELLEKGHFDRGYLGVGVQPMSTALA